MGQKQVALTELSILDLLQLHASVLDELKVRHVLRTKNNPVADYSEWLVSRSLKLTLVGNSRAGYDAENGSGIRYQIKARRLTAANSSTRLGAIRKLPERNFDVLVGVLFNADWSVRRAATVPHAVVVTLAVFQELTNSWILHLRPSLFDQPGVDDITTKLAV